MPSAVADTAISSSSQPPSRTRDRTSRPRKSAPRGNRPDGFPNGKVSRALGESGAASGPRTATATTKPARISPAAPRGVRTAAAAEASHWWRRIRSAGSRAAVIGTPPSYLGILCRGVTRSAITSVAMFMTT